MLLTELKEILPLELYGKGEAKDFESLNKEIESGESQIVVEDTRPIRLIKVCRVKIYFGNLFGNLSLWEDRQEFADGRVRRRNIEGLAEKLLPFEEPRKAATRAIKEELGIPANISINSHGIEEEEKESPSYPGLTTRYQFYDFSAFLPTQHWQAEYVEDSGDKKTYFVWHWYMEAA